MNRVSGKPLILQCDKISLKKLGHSKLLDPKQCSVRLRKPRISVKSILWPFSILFFLIVEDVHIS